LGKCRISSDFEGIKEVDLKELISKIDIKFGQH